MSIYDHINETISSMIGFGKAAASKVLSGRSSVVLRLIGDEDGDGNPDEDVDNCDVFVDAALISRPQDPDENGDFCEVLFLRFGDDRIVLGTKDRRHQRSIEKGEALLRALGFDGSRQAVLLLKPAGDVSLEGVNVVVLANEIKLGSDSASDYVALASLVKARLDALQSTFDSHIHTTTATVGTGPVGVISTPTTTVGPLADVASAKVKSE